MEYQISCTIAFHMLQFLSWMAVVLCNSLIVGSPWEALRGAGHITLGVMYHILKRAFFSSCCLPVGNVRLDGLYPGVRQHAFAELNILEGFPTNWIFWMENETQPRSCQTHLFRIACCSFHMNVQRLGHLLCSFYMIFCMLINAWEFSCFRFVSSLFPSSNCWHVSSWTMDVLPAGLTMIPSVSEVALRSCLPVGSNFWGS